MRRPDIKYYERKSPDNTPAKMFGGMTLAQFEAAGTPAREARQRTDELKNQLKQELATREQAD